MTSQSSRRSPTPSECLVFSLEAFILAGFQFGRLPLLLSFSPDVFAPLGKPSKHPLPCLPSSPSQKPPLASKVRGSAALAAITTAAKANNLPASKDISCICAGFTPVTNKRYLSPVKSTQHFWLISLSFSLCTGLCLNIQVLFS